MGGREGEGGCLVILPVSVPLLDPPGTAWLTQTLLSSPFYSATVLSHFVKGQTKAGKEHGSGSLRDDLTPWRTDPSEVQGDWEKGRWRKRRW